VDDASDDAGLHLDDDGSQPRNEEEFQGSPGGAEDRRRDSRPAGQRDRAKAADSHGDYFYTIMYSGVIQYNFCFIAEPSKF
jgi:hypothetical protein